MALVKDTLYPAGGRSVVSVVATDAVQFYVGSLVGVDTATGLAVLWSDAAGLTFVGVSMQNVLGDGTNSLRVDASGIVLQHFPVGGVSDVTAVGSLVYATDDNTLTLTSTTNVGAVGMISRYYATDACDVRLFTMTEYSGATAVDDLLLDGDVTITGKLTVNGPIDPPSLTLTSNDPDCFINFGPGEDTAVSASGTAALLYDNVAKALKVSLDGEAYEELGGVTFPLLSDINGSDDAVAFGWEDEAGTGLFKVGANVWLASNSETVVAFINVDPNKFQLRANSGDFTTPVYSAIGAEDSGLLINSDASVSLVVETVSALRAYTDHVTLVGSLDIEAVITEAYLGLTAGDTAAVSGAGTARLRYDAAADKVEVSKNGAEYAELGATVFPLTAPDGNAAAPSYAFEGGAGNYGLFLAAGAAGTSVAANGNEVARFTNEVQIAALLSDSAALPAFTFVDGNNYGMFLDLTTLASPAVGISDNGVAVLLLGGGNSQIMAISAGLEATPVFTLATDLDTGVYFPGADTMRMTAGGVDALEIGTAGIVVPGTVTVETNNGVRTTNQTSGNGAQVGTLTNMPTAGDPGFLLRIKINGTDYAIPAWAVPGE